MFTTPRSPHLSFLQSLKCNNFLIGSLHSNRSHNYLHLEFVIDLFETLKLFFWDFSKKELPGARKPFFHLSIQHSQIYYMLRLALIYRAYVSIVSEKCLWLPDTSDTFIKKNKSHIS
jgi:hypothetical protein